MRELIISLISVTLLILILPIACETAEKPPTAHTIYLKGDAYERGYQHGQRFSAHIRSLYTRLLTTSIIPFLNREQMSIAPCLSKYNQCEYRNGQFSYRMLLESGQHLYDNYTPEIYKEEMRGIADGAGVDLGMIIILNTFMDTMLAFRAIVMFIQGIQEPYIESLDFVMAADGVDNDSDGETDEEGEGRIEKYEPSPFAAMLEAPVDTKIKIIFEDPTLPGLACIDLRNVDPIGESHVKTRCVLPECVKQKCKGRETLTRDCFGKEVISCPPPPDPNSADVLSCLPPRISGSCLIPNCVEPTDPACVNRDSIRIMHNDKQYVASDKAIEISLIPPDEDGDSGNEEETNPYATDCQGKLEVIFFPAGGFEAASVHSLLIQSGDSSPVYSPAPYHNRFMRDERIVFTTEGYFAANNTGEKLHEIGNRGLRDSRSQPTSIGFAARGGATSDGPPLLAHHFALLDSGMVHEHSVLFVHIPEEHNIKPHAFLGYTGLVWGFSGMNLDGMTAAFNCSDTLDNPMVVAALKEIKDNIGLFIKPENQNLETLSEVLKEVRLLATGVPIGMSIRQVLAGSDTVEGGIELLYDMKRTYGWNIMLADALGDMAVIEVDSATQTEESDDDDGLVKNEDGFLYYGPDLGDPENLDENGNLWSSTGPDDIRMGSHFRKNIDDMKVLLGGADIGEMMGIFEPRRQRYWTGFYFRSLRAYYILGDKITERRGNIDSETAIEILRSYDLVDKRDSMCAAVYEPSKLTFHWAMGVVPASSGAFRKFDLGAELKKRGVQ